MYRHRKSCEHLVFGISLSICKYFTTKVMKEAMLPGMRGNALLRIINNFKDKKQRAGLNVAPQDGEESAVVTHGGRH